MTTDSPQAGATRLSAALRAEEAGTQGIRRIACAHIAAALRALDARKPDHEAVHTARKEVTRSRSALRLIRDALEADAFADLDALLPCCLHSNRCNDVRAGVRPPPRASN